MTLKGVPWPPKTTGIGSVAGSSSSTPSGSSSAAAPRNAIVAAAPAPSATSAASTARRLLLTRGVSDVRRGDGFLCFRRDMILDRRAPLEGCQHLIVGPPLQGCQHLPAAEGTRWLAV